MPNISTFKSSFSTMLLPNPMNKDEFWTLIEETKAQAGNDDELQQQLITKRLMQLPPQAISDFDDLLTFKTNQAYNHKLWAAAYIIDGGCSDDCFMDFQGWLIAQGRQVYEKVLADPDSLAELDSINGAYWKGVALLRHRCRLGRDR